MVFDFIRGRNSRGSGLWWRSVSATLRDRRGSLGGARRRRYRRGPRVLSLVSTARVCGALANCDESVVCGFAVRRFDSLVEVGDPRWYRSVSATWCESRRSKISPVALLDLRVCVRVPRTRFVEGPPSHGFARPGARRLNSSSVFLT